MQTFLDDPLTTPPGRCLNIAQLDLVAFSHDIDDAALGSLLNDFLRNENDVGPYSAEDAHCDELSWRESLIRIGKRDTKIPRSGGRTYGNIQQVQCPLMRIRAAVGKGDHALQFIEGRALDALLRSIPEAFKDEGLRCACVHIHGIQLVDHCQQVGLRGNEPAFKDSTPLDPTGDGSDDARVVEIKLGLHHIGIRPFQGRPRRQVFRDRIIHIFLAHRLLREQRLDAIKILFGLNQPRLRLRDFCFRTQIGGSKRHRIDLVEALALLDIASLRKESLLENPGYLRSNLDRPGGLRLTDKLRFVRDRLGHHGDYCDFWNRLSGSRRRLLLASDQPETPHTGQNRDSESEATDSVGHRAFHH